MRKRIEIWGSLPEPYGGVSVHVQRLIIALSHLDYVKLINFGLGRQILKQSNIRRSKGFTKELFRIILSKNIIVHLHTNRLVVLLFFSLLKRKRYIVTLHNKRFLKENKKLRKLFIISLKNATYVFSNDIEVQNTLLNQKVNLIKVPAFLPPGKSETCLNGLPAEFISFRGKFKFLFSMSIYGSNYLNEDDYGLRKLVQLLLEVKNENVGICLCISEPNQNDLAEFKKQLQESDLSSKVLFLVNTVTDGSAIWSNSDGFLRLNNTDIEGLSIKEALLLNVPVLCSDVCSRPNDTIVYQSDNLEDLKKKFISLIENNVILKKNLEQSSKSDIINAIDVIEPIYKLILA